MWRCSMGRPGPATLRQWRCRPRRARQLQTTVATTRAPAETRFNCRALKSRSTDRAHIIFSRARTNNMADNDEDGDAGAPRDRGYYLSQAYVNAFGVYDEPDWDPEKGYSANRDRIVKLYDYYQATYLKQPDVFLWAGLGRMAGGAVVGGLDLLAHGEETFLTKTMVRIGKAIFHDLAWL